MLTGEARKGDWAVFTDLIYVDFSSQQATVRHVTGPLGRVEAPIDTGSEVGLRSTVWTLAASYTAVRHPTATLDVFGGFRYTGIDASLNWQFAGPRDRLDRAGGVSRDVDLWDGIVGVRGRVRLGDSAWFVPYYVDVGAGSATLTWQGLLGVGYGFTWGDVALSFRNLYYDMDDDELLQNVRLTGPALSATFRF